MPMPATRKGCQRPRNFSVVRLRLNPCVRGASIRPPLAHAGKPTREERHGQGSDAQQQGKEEAEGGVEQEEERRPHALAVRVGPGATSARAESVRQEELSARRRGVLPCRRVASPERGVGRHKASATPQQSSCPPRNGGHRFSTSGDSGSRPDCPTSSILYACRARTARGMAQDYTPR